MATPNYKGQGQPGSSSGGFLGSLIGGSAPAYAGAGQPGSTTSKYFAGSAPAYKAAPASQDAEQSATDSEAYGPAPFAIVIPRQVIDQE